VEPLSEKRKLIVQAYSKTLGPKAVSVFPDIRFSNARSFLASILKDVRSDGLLFTGFSVICALLSMILPMILAFLVNEIIPYGYARDSYVISGVLFASLGALFCLQVVVNRIRLRLQTRIQSKGYFSYIRNVLNLSSGSMRQISGRVISLTMSFIDAAEAFTGSVVSVMIYLIQSIFALIAVVIYTTETGGIFIFLVCISLAGCIFLMRKRYSVRMKGREREEKLTGIRKEMIENNEAIKAYAAEDTFYYRHSLFYADYLMGNITSNTLQLLSTLLITMLGTLGVFFVIVVKLGGSSEYNLGAVSAVFSSISLFCSYFGMLVNSLMEIADEVPQLRLSDEVAQMPREQADDQGMEIELTGKIECSNLTFSYGEDLPNVIRDLSFTVNPGEYIGIVGGSGCGKSTLLRLLMGFETPTEGTVYYDGIDLQAWNLRALRRQFGVVLQDTMVMTGKIADNIAGIRQADIEEIREAARKAAILDDIEAMPMKFNTIISGESENVSGGQKQRILLARAILPNPKILFLDEATSALDNISQKKVIDSLDDMKVTRFVIAHRLSTVRGCDRIFVMDRGHIVEQGSYEELMQMDGLFKKLVERDMAASFSGQIKSQNL
jgi:ATP-binding cassette subfamily C protein